MVDLPFEDTVIPCPRQADAVLTRLFGDYMQLPAEDQRKNHAAAVLDFGEATD